MSTETTEGASLIADALIRDLSLLLCAAQRQRIP